MPYVADMMTNPKHPAEFYAPVKGREFVEVTETITLDQQGWDRFIDALEHPKQPTEALKRLLGSTK
jgi:uncharacterized protein (DUF1778 family)